jgi:uncharacterized lipoprotein YmbA
MMRVTIAGALKWLLGIALVMLIGCGAATSPVQFYALSVPEPPTPSPGTATLSDTIALGVGPLVIPKMLDRPQIVTRGTGNQLQVAEFHRWGGALNEDILRVLTERLSLLLETNQVMAHPWADFFEPDYRIHVVFHRFDGRLGEAFVLNATWTVTDPRGRKALAVKRSVINEPLAATDYESLVSASSGALEELCRQMAAEIRGLTGK